MNRTRLLDFAKLDLGNIAPELWIVAGICVLLALGMLVDSILFKRRLRRIVIAGPVGVTTKPASTKTAIYREITCEHCEAEFLVAKSFRGKEIDCVSCGEPTKANSGLVPAVLKTTLVRNFLRLLLYPSFQHRL